MRFSHLLVIAPLCILFACTGPSDTDEDMLSDNFELAIGTNPEIADSDGDGFADAMEYLAYFNPMDADDYPGEGEYVRFPSPLNHPNGEAEIDGSGWDEGDISNNWQLDDRFGDPLDLHDFFGQVIVIDVSAEWCGPCRNAAPGAEDEYNANKEEGFAFINLLFEGLTDGAAPDPERWATDLDLTFPIVGDQDREATDHYVPAGGFSIPNFSIIDRNMEIIDVYSVGSVDFGAVEDLLDEELPYVEWPLPENTEELRVELDVSLEHADIYMTTNVELGIELAGSGASTSGGGGSSEGGGTSGFTPSGPDGTYAGAPWGGSSCTSSGAPAHASSLLAVLFAALGLVGIRRR